ncbi:MAG: hypothetical protein KatS3mg035_1102 [Bacteroidia bacterium]|nr:MAG: hypothetical protein KatS3mg035_1102 [Bacteroidia bacterium]
MATGQTRDVRLITKRTSVPGKIPTGTTGNELNFIRIGELASNLADRKLFSYDGSNIFEFGSNSFLYLTGGTISGNTTIIGSFSANTIYSGSTDLYDIFQVQTNTLKQKNGSVSGSTFSGNPKKATVIFTTPFPDDNYAVTVTGEISRSWRIESKTASGFTINANANAPFTSSNVFWMAGQIGESV